MNQVPSHLLLIIGLAAQAPYGVGPLSSNVSHHAMPTPIEYSFHWKIATPEFAALGGFPLLLVVAAFTAGALYRLEPTRRTLRMVAFVAECFAAVGLIGAITIVGRLSIDQDVYEAEEELAWQRSELASQLGSFSFKHCPPGRPRQLLTTLLISESCNLAHEYRDAYSTAVDWSIAADRWNYLSFITSAESASKTAVSKLAWRTDSMRGAANEAALRRHKRRWQMRDDSLWILILCAVLAGAGIGLKMGRTFYEWRSE